MATSALGVSLCRRCSLLVVRVAGSSGWHMYDCPPPGGGVPVRRASTSRTESVFNVFDRSMKRRQKNWAASQANAQQYEYLREEIGERIVDRVFDVARTFPFALDIGSGRGYITPHLTKLGHVTNSMTSN